MEQFIQPIQYNILKEQAKKLVNGHRVTKDRAVIKALNKEQLEAYLVEIKNFVIPFPEVCEQMIKKIFPKDRKLKAPKQTVDERISKVYFFITDIGINRKYIRYEKEGDLLGRRGTYGNQVKKGICAICNHLEGVTMYMINSKKGNEGTYTKQGKHHLQG